MSVLEGSFQQMTIKEEASQEHIAIRDAELEGYEFIKLKLMKRIREDMEYRFGFVKGIVRVLDHVGLSGQQKVSFYPKDTQLIFRFDPLIRYHVGYLYRDTEGYNLGFLASHIELKEFQIMDPAIEAEVMELAAQRKAEAKEAVPTPDEPVLGEEQVAAMGEKAIDDQIAFLQQQKANLRKVPSRQPSVTDPPATTKAKAKGKTRRAKKPAKPKGAKPAKPKAQSSLATMK